MNPKYHLLVAAAALSLNACTTDDTDTVTEPEKGGYKISFTIAEDSETRTTLAEGDILRWVETDQVGIYTVGENKNPNTSTVAELNQDQVGFSGYLENLVMQGDKFYAYYPYSAEQSTDPSKVTLTIPADQMQRAAGVYNGQSHPLVAVPNTLSQGLDCDFFCISDVKFRLLGAIVELQIFSTDDMFCDEEIESVTFASKSAPAGDFTFDLTTVSVKEEPQISRNEFVDMKVRTTLDEPADVPDSKDEAARIYLTIAPGTYAGEFVVKTNVALYTFSLTEDKAMTFNRAMIKGLPADLATATRDILDLDAAISFKDPEVKRICVENWDTSAEGEEGKGELSYREAAAVTDLGTQFKENTTITSFNELRYFTGLKSIGGYAFYYCKNLKSVRIPDGVTTIEEYAFQFCGNLTSINIPKGVTTIGELAFGMCISLTSIHFPNGLTTIGENAFGLCIGLKSITIPETVTSIVGSFAGCLSLSAFYGKYASDNNRCLIQDGTLLAFAQAGLTAYTIPDGVTKIGEFAFGYCENLTNIHIPKEVAVIEYAAFYNCINLQSITIPTGVTAIGEAVFLGCSSLTEINIPTEVTAIKASTFWGCSNLTEIEIPEKVATIGEHAFHDCGKLESINIPERVTEISYSIFEGCSSLESITIPAGVTSIGNWAFQGCSSLTSVYCKPTTPPGLGSRAFYGTPSEMKIYVPTASVEAYKTATDKGWNDDYASLIVEDNSTTGE